MQLNKTSEKLLLGNSMLPTDGS